MNLPPIDSRSCIIRNTAVRMGRTRSVAPGVTASRYLHHGRIILAGTHTPVSVPASTHETGLVCLKGDALVEANGGRHLLTRYDAMYIPRDTAFIVAPGSAGCDLAELSAPVEGRHPLRFVAFADVKQNPALCFRTGGPGAVREIHQLLAGNIEAGRLVAGVTFSEPGQWTSWPPHEHSVMLEEAYLYVDMPAPAFAVQLVYTNPVEPELVTIVRESDVVLMPQGYHPNVAAPGCRLGFLWMMAAEREGEDRRFGVVNVQPDFAREPSGLAASHGNTAPR